jgi:hypothetical protein
MADQGEGAHGDPRRAGNPSKDDKGPEPYPPVRQDDAVEPDERRSFDPPAKRPGFEGPKGDPAEGKR